MKCDKCNYEWDNREPEPKACPRCKRRFDYPNKDHKPVKRWIKKMELITTKLIIVGLSCLALILIKPVVAWFMRDKYKTYKDVKGSDVKIKTQGYMHQTGNEVN